MGYDWKALPGAARGYPTRTTRHRGPAGKRGRRDRGGSLWRRRRRGLSHRRPPGAPGQRPGSLALCGCGRGSGGNPLCRPLVLPGTAQVSRGSAGPCARPRPACARSLAARRDAARPPHRHAPAGTAVPPGSRPRPGRGGGARGGGVSPRDSPDAVRRSLPGGRGPVHPGSGGLGQRSMPSRLRPGAGSRGSRNLRCTRGCHRRVSPDLQAPGTHRAVWRRGGVAAPVRRRHPAQLAAH